MGSFYLRKSVRAGPFRFNLSKSGIGVSAGVPGFRIGTGPRGNYIHAGRGGVYYRASLGAVRSHAHAHPVHARPERVPVWVPPAGGDVPMADVTGASALELAPSGRGDIVAQLNTAARRPRYARWATIALIIIAFVKPPIGLIVALVCVPGVVWLAIREQARRSVVAFFDVNDEAAEWFERVVAACEGAAMMKRIWRINASGNVRTTHQYKVNAGASQLVARTDVAFSRSGPKVLKTNIVVPTLRSGKDSLHFLPDRLLVSQGRKFSDVTYDALTALVSDGRFIENEGVPRDATQVDTTWRYANVKGGPDRRFKNNRQLPVLAYSNLELSSSAGLNWLLQGSKSQGFVSLKQTIVHAPASLGVESEPALDEEAAASTASSSEAGISRYRDVVEVPDDAGAGEAVEGTRATVVPRVPRTDAERDQLLGAKPPAWQYLLFASLLLAGRERLEPKWRDHQLAFSKTHGRKLSDRAALDKVEAALEEAPTVASQITGLLGSAALEPVFGAGEKADPAMIEHLCDRFIGLYEQMLDWSAELRSTVVSTQMQPLFDAASHSLDTAIVRVREFIDDGVAELDSVDERLRSDEPVNLVLALTLEVDDDVAAKLQEELAAARTKI